MSENKQHTKIIIIGEPKSGKSRLAAIIHNALITSQIQRFDVEVMDGEDFAINPHRLPMPVTVRDIPQDILIEVNTLREIEPSQIDWALDFIEETAKIAHHMNASYCRSIGDDSQPDWEDAPDWQKASAIKGVAFHLANPDAGPEASHNEWLKEKASTGWEYGEVKDPANKKHPCFVNFESLPPEQQYKDVLFKAVVEAERTESVFVWPERPDFNKKPLGQYSEEGSAESEQKGFDSAVESIPEIKDPTGTPEPKPQELTPGETPTANAGGQSALEKELESDSNLVHDSETADIDLSQVFFNGRDGIEYKTEDEAKDALDVWAEKRLGIKLDRRNSLADMAIDLDQQLNELKSTGEAIEEL